MSLTHRALASATARPSLCEGILCHQEERIVARDNTVRFAGLVLQIPENPGRPHFVKAPVRVHRYPGGALAIFHGPRRIARYDATGRPIEEKRKRAA